MKGVLTRIKKHLFYKKILSTNNIYTYSIFDLLRPGFKLPETLHSITIEYINIYNRQIYNEDKLIEALEHQDSGMVVNKVTYSSSFNTLNNILSQMIYEFIVKDKRWSKSERIEKLLCILDNNGVNPSQMSICSFENQSVYMNGFIVRRTRTTFCTEVNKHSLKDIIDLTWEYKDEKN